MKEHSKENDLITYKGCNFLKQRLILSTLSGKPIQIIEIRAHSSSAATGLQDYEISLIRLFDKLTNGTTIDINESGTSIYYRPGLLHGGVIHHECNIERGIGYYLDVLIALGPFCKIPINCNLKGVTNSHESPSVDHIKGSAIPHLKRFLVVDDGLDMKILRRGLAPTGGGEIQFKCPVRKNIRSIQCLKSGMVKRIRGTAYSTKVSPALANRTLEAAKGVLLNFIPDIYIHTDHNKGKQSGKSPGFGINLIAETTEGVFYSTELCSNIIGGEPTVPEDLGKAAAQKLLEEIYRGGCVDSCYQWLTAMFMVLSQKDVSKFLTGPFSTYTIHFLQHIREFFNVTFKLENPELDENDNGGADDDDDDKLPGSNKVLMTCVGIGYTNMNKRTN